MKNLGETVSWDKSDCLNKANLRATIVINPTCATGQKTSRVSPHELH